MAKSSKYKELSEKIMTLMGGKENIGVFAHCVTRLRFNAKDKSLVKSAEIEGIPGVIGTQWQGDQFQIIIGQSVSEAYNLICKEHGFKIEGTVGEEIKEKKQFSFMSIADVIAGCITPVIPVLIGAGLLKVVMLLGNMFGLLSVHSQTYITLSFVSDAAFYFLPIYVGASSAKKFGSNMWMGMFFGAVLLSPKLAELLATGNAGSIFGLPIYGDKMLSYANSIFPTILTVFVASHVERLAEKYAPDYLKSMLVPLLTMLIMTPLMLCALAPVGSIIGNYLADGIIWLYDTTGFLCVAVFAVFYPLLVMTGMHHGLTPYALQSLATLRYEPLVQVAQFVSNINQGVAALAVAVKTKNKNLRSVASSCAIPTVLCGITEPTFFGITLKYKTPLYAALIGNFVGGLIEGLCKVVTYQYAGSWGIFGLPVFMGEKSSNFMFVIIAIIVGSIVTFIMTLLLYKDPEVETKEA